MFKLTLLLLIIAISLAISPVTNIDVEISLTGHTFSFVKIDKPNLVSGNANVKGKATSNI